MRIVNVCQKRFVEKRAVGEWGERNESSFNVGAAQNGNGQAARHRSIRKRRPVASLYARAFFFLLMKSLIESAKVDAWRRDRLTDSRRISSLNKSRFQWARKLVASGERVYHISKNHASGIFCAFPPKSRPLQKEKTRCCWDYAIPIWNVCNKFKWAAFCI